MEAPYHDVRYVAAESEQDAADKVARGKGRHALAEAIADCDEWTAWGRSLGRSSSPAVYAVELVVKPVSRETYDEPKEKACARCNSGLHRYLRGEVVGSSSKNELQPHQLLCT